MCRMRTVWHSMLVQLGVLCWCCIKTYSHGCRPVLWILEASTATSGRTPSLPSRPSSKGGYETTASQDVMPNSDLSPMSILAHGKLRGGESGKGKGSVPSAPAGGCSVCSNRQGTGSCTALSCPPSASAGGCWAQCLRPTQMLPRWWFMLPLTPGSPRVLLQTAMARRTARASG